MLDSKIAIYGQQLRSRFDWLREADPTPTPRRRCSWPSTSSTLIVPTWPRVRGVTVARGR